MKLHLAVTALILLLLGACLDASGEEDLDVQPPSIGALSATGGIAPAQFITIPADADRIPVAFEVADNEGLSEIRLETHSAFDGHLHGRSDNSNDFFLLKYRQRITREDLADPLVFRSEAGDDLDIFLDDRNPFIPTDGLLLAGPYHFSIKAVDASGNETSYDDNSTYHGTLFLQRAYAPQIEVDGVDQSRGAVTGKVRRNQAHPASADIVFLWAYLVTPDPNNPAREGDVGEEWIWGTSNWPHQFRPDSGAPLPDGGSIDLADLLRDEEAIRQMKPTDRLRLWAEDENGNVSVYTSN